jgi:hypothetical protein
MNEFNERAGVAERWSEFPPELLELMDRDRAQAGPDHFLAYGVDQIRRPGRRQERRSPPGPLSGQGVPFACETLAEALERLRSGSWLRRGDN